MTVWVRLGAVRALLLLQLITMLAEFELESEYAYVVLIGLEEEDELDDDDELDDLELDDAELALVELPADISLPGRTQIVLMPTSRAWRPMTFRLLCLPTLSTAMALVAWLIVLMMVMRLHRALVLVMLGGQSMTSLVMGLAWAAPYLVVAVSVV